MKKLLFSLFTLLLISGLTYGQESPEKALSKAGRALGSYNLDPTNNTDKLKEAVKLIEIAANSDVTNGKFKTWNTRGEIYSALADKDINMLSLMDVESDSDFKLEHPEAPVTAAQSFEKAYSLAVKKYEKKDALTGLKDSYSKLNLIGNNQIQNADYSGAYTSLNTANKVNDVVVGAGEDPVIPAEDMANHQFVLAYCAQAAGKATEAKDLFKKLYEGGSKEESVYSSYATILIEDGKNEEAIAVLNKGSEMFPASTDILFAKINYYISIGDQDALRSELEKAIEKEPNNPSVHSALGNVYMQLFTDAYGKDRASEAAGNYFSEAEKYFNNAVNLDPKAFDAIYSIGSLFFNRAAEDLKYANTLNIKQEDEYNAAIESANSLMEKALPYFQKAESINPNDGNTLIALKEIYARNDDFDKVNEFKSRLEKVQAGESNTSYFKE